MTEEERKTIIAKARQSGFANAWFKFFLVEIGAIDLLKALEEFEALSKNWN